MVKGLVRLFLDQRFVLVMLLPMLVSCASPAAPGPQSGTPVQSGLTGPKRVVAAVVGEHPQIISKFLRTLQGAEAVEVSVASGLSIRDFKGTRHPLLAEAVPTIENGLWKLRPDGTMEVTWNLRPNALWHDGKPFTTDDILFTAQVAQSDVAPNFRQNGQDLVLSIDASSSRTVTVQWKAPYIRADTLFNNDTEGTSITFTLPKHVLERPLAENKDGFLQLSYWSEDFIGSGPFRLKQFNRGSGILLAAFDQYVLGRPKIDEFEIKFAGDASTQIATILSGAADMSLGHSLSVDQSANVEPQWLDGHVDNVGLRSRFAIYPQFINPNPVIVANLQFRKALMYAMDRQEMADSLQRGKSPVAHTYMSPEDPIYPAVEPMLVKYEFDPRRAVQMIEGLGYTRGGDGIFRDASGQRLAVEERATPGDLEVKIIESIRDYWQNVGVESQAVPIPLQRQTDGEYRATRGSFEFTRRGTSLNQLASFKSSETPLPENGYQGGNISRYQSREWDGLIDRFFVTVPLPERTQVVAQIMRHVSDNLNMMHIFYDMDPLFVSNRLVNVRGRQTESSPAWNVFEWDVTS